MILVKIVQNKKKSDDFVLWLRVTLIGTFYDLIDQTSGPTTTDFATGDCIGRNALVLFVILIITGV